MIGIIGGSGVYEITQKADSVEKKLVKTDYGEVEVSILDIFNKTVAFIPRHAAGHSIPPHKINFRANIDALRNVGVTQIIATNSVGSMNLEMPDLSRYNLCNAREKLDLEYQLGAYEGITPKQDFEKKQWIRCIPK